jgi:septal ring factor EnvC (AmiA/AmiB activator)
LSALYRHFGGEAAEGAKKQFASLLDEDDLLSLEKIALLHTDIGSYEEEITKLKASLEIDEKKREIQKLETAITEQQRRIAAAETAIAEYKQKITAAQARIEELGRVGESEGL